MLLIAPRLFAGDAPKVPLAQSQQSSAPVTGELSGKVVDQNGKPVAGAKIEAHVVRETTVYGHIRATTDADGNWKARRLDVPAQLVAKSADGKLATALRLEPDKSEITLTLAPAAEAHGRLLDDQGTPAANQKLTYAVRVPDDETNPNSPWVNAFGGTVTTDAHGKFNLTGLVPGKSYDVDFPIGGGRSRRLASVEPTSAQMPEIELRMPKPDPTLAERTAQYFGTRDDFAKLVENAQKFAGPQALRVLLVVGDPKSEVARGYVKLREDHSADVSLFELLDDYEQLAVSTDDRSSMDVLKGKYGLDAEQLKPLSLVVLAGDNGVLASKKLPLEAFTDRKALNEELREFTKAHALPRPDAKELLAAAFNRARQEGKQVLLEESGTYCGWCRILSRFFDRHPDVFEAYFLPVRIDRSRFAHGEHVMKQYRSTEGGIPWCAIVDANGKKLADWDTPDGNMGYPTLPKEFDYLSKILKQSAPKITDQQLAELRTDLEQEAKKYQQH